MRQQELRRKKNFKIILIIVASIVVGLILISLFDDDAKTPLQKNKSSSSINDTADSVVNRQTANSETADSSKTSDSNHAGQMSASDREEKIQKVFSPWNGSVIKLVDTVKIQMDDPDSFEHISTSYWDKGNYLIVIMKFRGKNEFGANVVNYVKAKVDLDGNVLEILNNE